jgi:hypothetical protein
VGRGVERCSWEKEEVIKVLRVHTALGFICIRKLILLNEQNASSVHMWDET